MKELIVSEKYDNIKLDKFLLNEIPKININTIYKLLRKKDIKINGKRVNKNITVNSNDQILVYINEDSLNNKKIKKIYEDENILIIDKPINIEIQGMQSLTNIIHKLYSESEYKPMPCHRLDMNTSGLILYAKNKQSLDILLDKFKNKEIEKHYLALIYGMPKEQEKRLEAYLFKDNKKSQVYISDMPKKGYVKIITKYKVLQKNENNTSVLDVEIETGKTHQIRAHLAHIGYPIIGDGKYGKNKINKQFKRKYQMLTSYKIKFNFKTDAGILNYLNKKEFTKNIDINKFKNS